MDFTSILIRHFNWADLWNIDISNEFGEYRKQG